jgi:hypothetical protein
MSLESILNGLQLRRTRRQAKHGPSGRRPRFETFEDRCLLSLTPGLSYSVGSEPQAVVAADFNNDGRLDLATANTGDNTVSVLLGDGQGGFGWANISATGDNPVSLAVGDFNDDGTLDLAAADGAARGVNVMFGNGDGTFRAPTHIPVGFSEHGQRGPGSLATGDFNGDGRMDLVVTSNYRPDYYSYPQGLADVLLAVGDGSFRAPRTYWAYNRALGAAVVTDFNADGFQDLVTEMPDYSAVIVLLGDGQGNVGNYEWAGPVAAIGGNPTAAADLNGDGNIDLVSAPGPREGYNAVGIILGDGNDGSLNWIPDFYAVGGTPDTAILGDFDRDGLLDIAATVSANNDVNIVRGRGDGTFSPAEDFAVGLTALSGDFDLDDRVDGHDFLVWQRNPTVGALADWRTNYGQSVDLDDDPRPISVAGGDFNGDGWLDLATVNANANSVSVLFNDQLWSVVPPGVSVSDATVAEGNSGAVNATFTVTLSKAAAVDVTVHYETVDGAATAVSDYVAVSGDVVIPAGQTSRTFTVAVLGDRVAEPTETFAVNLSAPVNATIADGQGLGTILDNEPQISINDVAKSEGKGNKTTLFTFTVTLSAAYDQPVTMSYQTVNGTAATADNDYIAKTGTLTFDPGETTKTITIEVKADNKKESDETFYLDLINNSSNSLFSKFRGIGTIWNDD